MTSEVRDVSPRFLPEAEATGTAFKVDSTIVISPSLAGVAVHLFYRLITWLIKRIAVVLSSVDIE
jgi:hypothetical protein